MRVTIKAKWEAGSYDTEIELAAYNALMKTGGERWLVTELARNFIAISGWEIECPEPTTVA